MRKFTAFAVIVSVIAIGAIWYFLETPATAKDSPGCKGLASYRSEMLKIENTYLADREVIVLRHSSVFDRTSADFNDLNEVLKAKIASLKLVNPPVFAQSWHTAYLDFLDVESAVLDSAEQGSWASGFLKHDDAITASLQSISDANDLATSTCKDFRTFNDEWFGLDFDGNLLLTSSPIATPTS